MAKYIFVTGGVVSSVGKGITVASVGRILKSHGLSVSVIKLDPYLNVDPGTMSPYQHGEVFVTRDGGETDLDLGHYERFIDIELTKRANATSGQVYQSLLMKERRGDFLGGTIQVVPHLTNEIKRCVRAVAEESKADVVVVEVGGTVGDIEGLPFLEAIRQMRRDEGRNNTFYIHVTLLPHIGATGELKTKPTQHSVRELRSIGIQPDAIICRSDEPVEDSLREKIALFCDVRPEAVIPLITVSNIYRVPIILEQAHLCETILEDLGIHGTRGDMSQWARLVDEMEQPKEIVPIAVVGKYVELPDSYISVKESLKHAALHSGRRLDIRWIHSEEVERQGPDALLKDVSGIVVPGGFGPRGIEGMIATARYARENNVPYLGLCLGMQVMVTEYARNVLGWSDANSTEFNPDSSHPVIYIMPEQENITDKGGTMRLGNYPCRLVPGTLAHRAYGVDLVDERHRHRYEVNNKYRQQLEEAGLTASGVSPDGKLVEISEVRGSVHAGRAVPPGVPLAPRQAASAVLRLHGCSQGDSARGRAAAPYTDRHAFGRAGGQ